MYTILKKTQINPHVVSFVIHAPRVAKRAQPGHFVIVRVNEMGERIPLTIVDTDQDQGTIEIIVQTLGYSTTKLNEKQEGEAFLDVMGPLGKAAHQEHKYHVLGIAGGIGAAPLLPQLKALHAKGTKVDLILGARTKDLLILVDRFEPFCEDIFIATDDGSMGQKGFVTTILTDQIHKKPYDYAITIGPAPMMRAVVDITKKANIETSVSLNPIMIDGSGMCGECRVTIAGQTKFACIDGPDFSGFDVDFDELISRQNVYKDQERHTCKVKLGDPDA